MGEIRTDQLKKAAESRHGGKATLVQSVPVHERQGDHIIWSGQVSVFDLRFSTSGAFRAYAWWRALPDGEPQLFTVLHSPETISPAHAVRSTMLAETEK